MESRTKLFYDRQSYSPFNRQQKSKTREFYFSFLSFLAADIHVKNKNSSSMESTKNQFLTHEIVQHRERNRRSKKKEKRRNVEHKWFGVASFRWFHLIKV